MCSSSLDINYARFSGIQSLPAAIVFTILYVPFFVWFLLQAINHRKHVYIVLSAFCLIRIAAFAIRAALAGSESAGHNLGLLIADQVLISVGFFTLLYSAYSLVLDRQRVTEDTPTVARNLFKHATQLTRNRRFFQIILIAAVALGVSGSSLSFSSDPKDAITSWKLRKASAIIFLILTALQAFQTLLLVWEEFTLDDSETVSSKPKSFSEKHDICVLCLISMLLLVRESFATETIVRSSTQENNERFWYPLIAVPELLAIILYAVHGIMTSRTQHSKVYAQVARRDTST